MVSYNYQTQRSFVFTEEGQVMFLKIRDHAKYLLKISGAAMGCKIWADCSGDVWNMMACVDRLVELGELRQIDYGPCAAQHQIYMKGPKG